MARVRRKPEYTLHASTGQARVRINGRDHYLGRYGTPESKQQYREMIRSWRTGLSGNPTRSQRGNQPIDELAIEYLEHAKSHYVKNGEPTSELGCIRLALRFLVKAFGETPIRGFGPKSLMAVRDKMVKAGFVRTSINRHVARIVRMFDWGVAHECVPASVTYRLSKVTSLKAGRCAAPEGTKVKPVPMDAVNAVEPHVSRPVWGAIQVQLWTAMRPGEVLAMRGRDIDRSGDIWVYTVGGHKTEHHGHERTVYIGPRAQSVLVHFLTDDPDAYLFNPKAGRQEYLKMFKGPGRRRKSGTKGNQARDHYTPETFHRAIRRGCEKAFGMPDELRRISRKLPKAKRDELQRQAIAWRKEHCWHPHRLRHTGATIIRKETDLETARLVLGHSSAVTSEIYAEADTLKMQEVMRKIG